MAEIIIAILLQITTLMGGQTADPNKADKSKEKSKTESPKGGTKSNGGSGNYNNADD